MTDALPRQDRHRPGASRRARLDALGIVIRAVALAALALGLGVGASLLVDSHTGRPEGAAVRR